MKRLVQSTLNRFGYRLARVQPFQPPKPPAASLDRCFSALKRLGFAPKRIIDVGANHGNWTRVALDIFPDAHYTLVEPQDHLKVYVQDLVERGCKIEWINAGASDEPGTLQFGISYRDDSSSFLLGENPVDGGKTISVRVTTLNEIVAMSGAPAPEMVKIDAEGFDMKVLAGASDLFGKTEVFFVEAAVCSPGFENTLLRVVSTMDQAGYRLVDFTDLNRSPKNDLLWLCEAAFVRKGSQLFAGVTQYE